jgi:hypothetical protein
VLWDSHLAHGACSIDTSVCPCEQLPV